MFIDVQGVFVVRQCVNMSMWFVIRTDKHKCSQDGSVYLAVE